MKKINFILIIVLSLTIFSTSCKKDGEKPKFNLFSLEDDKKFGAQFDQEIMSNPDFKILSETTYSTAYGFINQYKTKLLNTGKVEHAQTFNWKVRIIANDNEINAFAVPGGYMYFYTGLIKALESEAEFTGVMAHEMAHVARRHSTAQLTKAYGLELLLGMLLGQSSNQWVTIARQLATGLAELEFSRTDEFEADKYSVNYTYVTDWDSRGVAYFFKKMMEPHPVRPVFLSTHPADQDRIDAVEKEWINLGKKEGSLYVAEYQQFKNSLP